MSPNEPIFFPLYLHPKAWAAFSINRNLFFDYKRHKDMFDDERSLILYYGLMNSDKRKEKIKKINNYAIFALIFSLFVRIYHIPRLIKLKYFKKTGKQNYTWLNYFAH